MIMMQINVARILGNSGASFTAQGTTHLGGDLGPVVRLLSPANIQVTLTNTGRFLHVEGSVEAGLTTECVRCLAPVELEIAVPFTGDYLPESEFVLAEESANEFTPLTGNILDVDPVAREAVLLAIPMRPLCREDCPGLCHRCGYDLNIGKCPCEPSASHPGFDVLARLLPKKEV
jgi:uncharacterized protein